MVNYMQKGRVGLYLTLEEINGQKIHCFVWERILRSLTKANVLREEGYKTYTHEGWILRFTRSIQAYTYDTTPLRDGTDDVKYSVMKGAVVTLM